MAVGKRSGATASQYLSNQTTASLTPSSLPQDGDWIVAVAMSLSARTWSLPTGFEKLGPTVSDGQTSIQLLAKRARAGESAPYVFTANTGTYGPVFLDTYTGVADIGPISYWDTDESSGTSVTWPNITVPVSGGAALVISTTMSAATFSTPSGWTAGYTGARGKTFEKLNPSTGTLAGPSSTASVDEPHTLLSLFLTPTLQKPVNVTAPSLSGNAWQGQDLALNLGDWLGADTFDVVYQRDGVDI